MFFTFLVADHSVLSVCVRNLCISLHSLCCFTVFSPNKSPKITTIDIEWQQFADFDSNCFVLIVFFRNKNKNRIEQKKKTQTSADRSASMTFWLVSLYRIEYWKQKKKRKSNCACVFLVFFSSGCHQCWCLLLISTRCFGWQVLFCAFENNCFFFRVK